MEKIVHCHRFKLCICEICKWPIGHQDFDSSIKKTLNLCKWLNTSEKSLSECDLYYGEDIGWLSYTECHCLERIRCHRSCYKSLIHSRLNNGRKESFTS